MESVVRHLLRCREYTTTHTIPHREAGTGGQRDTAATRLVLKNTQVASNDLVFKHGAIRQINACALICYDDYGALHTNANTPHTRARKVS